MISIDYDWGRGPTFIVNEDGAKSADEIASPFESSRTTVSETYRERKSAESPGTG